MLHYSSKIQVMKAIGCDVKQLFLLFTAVDPHGSDCWKYRNRLLYALINDCVSMKEKWSNEYTYTLNRIWSVRENARRRRNGRDMKQIQK
jgi:hypothetical protein